MTTSCGRAGDDGVKTSGNERAANCKSQRLANARMQRVNADTHAIQGKTYLERQEHECVSSVLDVSMIPEIEAGPRAPFEEDKEWETVWAWA